MIVELFKSDCAPKDPYGSFLDLENDQQYGKGTGPLKHNLKTGAQIPVEIVAEVDRKIDDGLPYSGAFQFSTHAAPGGTPPVATGAQGCIDTAATPNGGRSEAAAPTAARRPCFDAAIDCDIQKLTDARPIVFLCAATWQRLSGA